MTRKIDEKPDHNEKRKSVFKLATISLCVLARLFTGKIPLIGGDIKIQTWITEYQLSRNLIQDYQKMQHNLISINASSVGVIITVAIALHSTDTPMEYFFLAIPLISGLLGIYWISLGIKTMTVSDYVLRTVAPRLQTLVEDKEAMGFESYFKKNAGMFGDIPVINVITTPAAIAGFTFVFFSAAGLWISGLKIFTTDQSDIKVLWWISLGLTIFLVLYGTYLGARFRSNPNRKV